VDIEDTINILLGLTFVVLTLNWFCWQRGLFSWLPTQLENSGNGAKHALLTKQLTNSKTEQNISKIPVDR